MSRFVFCVNSGWVLAELLLVPLVAEEYHLRFRHLLGS